MSDNKSKAMDKRVPLTADTFESLRDFSRGLGVSYDKAVVMLLKEIKKPDEDSLLAGRRMRDKLQEKETA